MGGEGRGAYAEYDGCGRTGNARSTHEQTDRPTDGRTMQQLAPSASTGEDGEGCPEQCCHVRQRLRPIDVVLAQRAEEAA